VSFLREVQLDDSFGPYVAFRGRLGFVPNVLRAQSLLPRVIEAQATLESAVLLQEKALSRVQKEQILLLVAASQQDTYCVAAHSKILASLGKSESELEKFLNDHRHAGLPTAEVALLDFCLKLSHHAPWVHWEDIEGLHACGFDDESIMEGVLVTGLAAYLRVLSAGLGPEPDFEPRKLPSIIVTPPQGVAFQGLFSHGPHTSGRKGPFIRTIFRSPKTFAPFAILQESHGFVPNFFRSQTLRPDLLEAEAEAVGAILIPEDVLNRVQKECILLVVSAANLNSYCVAVHCNLLRGLGITTEEGDQIAVDYHESILSEADKALVEFTLKVGSRPSEFSPEDIDRLRSLGFSEEQILESEVVTALNNFANTVQMGLGILADFEPPPVFAPKKVHLPPEEVRRTEGGSAVPLHAAVVEDSDAGLVASAQDGDLEAFEDLIRRHSRSVYRTLMAILGDPEETKDAMQDAFLSAFKHIAGFQGRSKFSTWLVSIARNTALQRLRERKDTESLDDGAHGDDGEFRPRQVRAWVDDPEQVYSKTEIRQLVERGIMRLPVAYRVVVMLRDIEELSTDDVARELGLSVPAVKARLLRGRLMLRELLSPHFAARAGGARI